MQTPAIELLEKLVGMGAVLEPRGDRLAIRFPEARRAEVEKLRPEVAAQKPDLLALLSGRKPEPAAWPTRRCYRCNGFLFWRSSHGAVLCALCHPPAARDLVREWWWLPDGQARRVQ
ncbi:MAG: hypothetical protein HY647_07365 [Acidobacteria bacterium]|nr:hypothetical protein [Acidobacteriota bacterium]